MGELIRLADHADISAADLKLKTRRSACRPRRSNSSEKITKYSAGIMPAAFQLETAEPPTRAIFAAADGPPTASTTASTEPSMPPDTSLNVKLSSLHDAAVEFCQNVRFANGMVDSRDQIVFRLRLLPEVLGRPKNEIAAAAGVTPSVWSNYVSDTNKNVITWKAASELHATFGLSLDWIYCGDAMSIRDEGLRLKIRKAERDARAKRQVA